VSADPFEAIAAELYGLVPAEFTGVRNDYAKQLRDDGDRELSDRVKALRKPAAAAWVVNLLVRHDAEEMASVLELGESLRQAQADLDGDALRELAKQRRRLIAAVAGKGRTLARDQGQKISESVVRQVEDTLHAAMIDADAASAVRTGLLVDPLSPSGVGSLKVATAVKEHTALGSTARPLSEVVGPAGSRKKSGLRAVPGPDAKERAAREAEERAQRRTEATEAVASAEEDVAEARATLAAHEKAVQDLQAQCLQVNGEIDELKRKIDELEDRLEQLDDESDDARAERDQAAEQVALAESALAEAKAALDALGD
jgi:cell division protein FtsL